MWSSVWDLRKVVTSRRKVTLKIRLSKLDARKYIDVEKLTKRGGNLQLKDKMVCTSALLKKSNNTRQ